MQLTIPLAQRTPSSGSPCQHHVDCSCRRPYLGRSLIIAVVLELLMGVIAIATGATLIGVVACASMAGCTWLYALTEIVAFYRVGLPEADRMDVGTSRGQGHRPHQAF